MHPTIRPDEARLLIELLNGDGGSPDMRQTHISFVALTPRSAYKRLKPVRFDFLDFSTREGRYVHLANEARLNRRLAGNVYRGLIPLWGTERRWTLAGFGPPDDWLLAMERLPDAATLETTLKAGKLDARGLDRIVTTLVAFFQTAERSDEITANGDPLILRRNLAENFDVLETAAGNELPPAQVASLRSRQLQAIVLLDEELRTRQQQGWIRNGHGDLRAEHVYLTDPVQVIDCIAFNHRLRWIDTADDVNFLATDLIRLGGATWADQLVEGYRDATSDPASDRLLAFYRSYRFAVRAKVAVLRSREQAGQTNAASLQEAAHYLEFATEALSETRPLLVVVCGLSGTGKTTIAAALAARLGAVHLSSDRIRKEIHGREPTDRSSPESLYSATANEAAYRELLSRAGQRLGEETGVVLDATFLRKADRDTVVSLAAALKMRALFVECRCSEVEIERRLAERTARGDDASDATLDVWHRQRTISDGYAGLRPADHLVVDSGREAAAIVDEIVIRLKAR